MSAMAVGECVVAVRHPSAKVPSRAAVLLPRSVSCPPPPPRRGVVLQRGCGAWRGDADADAEGLLAGSVCGLNPVALLPSSDVMMLSCRKPPVMWHRSGHSACAGYGETLCSGHIYMCRSYISACGL